MMSSSGEDNLTETDQVPSKSVENGLSITVAFRRMDEIARTVKLSGRAHIEHLEELDELYRRVGNEDLKKMIADHLAAMKIAVVLKKTLTYLDKSSRGFQVLLKIFENYTDASRNIRLQLGRVGILRIIVQFLESNIAKHDLSYERSVACMSILYNSSKENENKKLLRCKDSMEILSHHSREKEIFLKMLAILTLSYVVDDENKFKIFAADSLIITILEHITKGLQVRNHKFGGWTVVELVAGLKNLSSNKENSLGIVRNGALQILADILLSGNTEEKEIAGETIWALSFQDDNKAAIAGSETVMKSLREASDGTGTAQVSARGTLWMLDNTNRAEERINRSYDPHKPHIMISYQWEAQELMDRVYEKLKSRGYNVWMDIHEMSGSILETMAAAVENAGIVLVCLSQKYENSPNCRTEAEYAFKLRRPIVPVKVEQDYKANGWLGALLGTRMYVKFCGLNSYHGETFDKKIEKLVVEIERSGVNSVTLSPEKTHANSTTKSNNLLDATKPVPTTTPRRPEATNSERQNGLDAWITKHNLLSHQIGTLTTDELIFLRHLKSHASDTFYRFLSGMVTIDKLREMKSISKAIDDFHVA